MRWGGFNLPDDWRDRHDADAFVRAVAELGYAEADVLRVEERLRVAAPHDDHWEELYSFGDEAVELVGKLGHARTERDLAFRAVADMIARWDA